MARLKRYFNYKNYLRFIFNYVFKLLEKRKLARTYNITQPQFFITGLPRTGTTLVYQYMVHRLDMAYFTNKTGDYYMTPCAVTWLSRLLLPAYKSNFTSNYGKVSGLMAPREAGAFWLRFFDIHAYTEFQAMQRENPLEHMDTLKKTVACIQHIFNNAPLVNKNVKHMLRLNALEQLFPDACFIIVERDFSDVALSVLEGRKKNTDNPDQWWSVRPPSYDTLKTLPYLDQVARQVHDLNQKLQQDLEQLSPDRVIRLDYRQFCQNPETVIDKIKKRCPAIETRNPPVNSFQYNKRLPATPEEEELVRKVEQLF